MAGIEDILRKQAELGAIAVRMKAETDGAKVQHMTEALQRESQELQKMALAYEKEQQARSGSPKPREGGTALTPEQQQAEAQRRSVVEKILADIERASPAAAEAVAKLKADPGFLDGMFAKK
jgi:hypothetical protein